MKSRDLLPRKICTAPEICFRGVFKSLSFEVENSGPKCELQPPDVQVSGSRAWSSQLSGHGGGGLGFRSKSQWSESM